MDQLRKKTRIVHRQDGAYTLITVIFLLLIFGLSSVFATQISVDEIRISNNSYRILQAKQNAHTALSKIFTDVKIGDLKELSADDKVIRNYTDLQTLSGKPQGTARAEISRISESSFIAEIDALSSDHRAKYRLSQEISYQELLHSLPRQAVISTKEIHLSQASEILGEKEENNDPLVWAGGPASIDIDNTRIIQNDLRLMSLSQRTFIENFLLVDKEGIQEFSTVLSCVERECSEDHINNALFTFVDGDLTVAHDLGSPSSPMLLVVDGNLTLENNSTIFGLVIQLKNLSNNIQAGHIQGALVVYGHIQIDGVVRIEYDQNILNSLKQRVGYLHPMAGGWRDF